MLRALRWCSRVLFASPERRVARSELGLASERAGRRGERAACRHLRRTGYRILARRLRTRGGEVDVVALDGETLVLVEVKTTVVPPAKDAAPRDAAASALERIAFDRVDEAKRKRLRAAWSALARRPGLASRPLRCDVVAVVLRGRRAHCHVVRGFVRLTDRCG